MGEEDQYESGQEGLQEGGSHADEEILAAGDSSLALAAKEQEREKIRSDIEAFLSAGGEIHNIDNNVVADPPKRPQSSYGSQPI